jgi:single-strand DNA-binding protein
MSSLNKVMIIGNLGNNPEMRKTSNGTSVATLSIATNRRYKGKDGNWTDDTQWHRIVVWAKQAENCKKYLSKGSQVYVEGRLQTRQWEDKDGNKRFTTEVVADSVQFLGKGGGSTKGNDNSPPPHTDADQPSGQDDTDLPF